MTRECRVGQASDSIIVAAATPGGLMTEELKHSRHDFTKPDEIERAVDAIRGYIARGV